MHLNKEIKISPKGFEVRDRYQILEVQEWGIDTVRVISSPNHNYNKKYGIEELTKNKVANMSIERKDNTVILKNGKIKVIYDNEKLTFFYKDKVVLEEYSRKQSDVRRTIGIDSHVPIKEQPTSSLNISSREFKYKYENVYETKLIFEGDSKEKIFGLGGYQEENLNKNYGTYELMQRNSQTSIPFYISNKNYGFIWNNASIGEVTFSKNQKKWISNSSETIDYIVTIADTPKEILANFSEMTGRAPRIDEDLLGLWQSKLRYQTIDELRNIYNSYVQRKINLSVLVIDYFHWTADGDFEFDMRYWDGIKQFAEEIKENGTHLMVSLWPTVTDDSKYYGLYRNNQMLIRSVNNQDKMFDGKEILDFTNPLTAVHVKKILKENYQEHGIELFWADQAEPEMSLYNHEKYQVYEGNFEKISNKYPFYYLKTVQDSKENVNIMSPVLIRSAWFNSQKYGALAWSGDIESSFNSLKKQIQISISMGLSGIPWWTSDIAGFHSGDSTTKSFKELVIRWFQFAVFTPILRMHGDRQPHTQKIGKDGGGVRTSGGPNEIWSFGEDVEKILVQFLDIRVKLKEYIKNLFKESSEFGHPIIRSLFYEFPDDENTWEDTTNYMFGDSLLIVPVVKEGCQNMDVYLPKGVNWVNVFTKEVYEGGKCYNIELSIDKIPVFCKIGSPFESQIEKIF